MSFAEQVREHGYAVVEGVFDEKAALRYIDLLCNDDSESSRGGRRNLLCVPEIRELAVSDCLMELVEPVLGDGAFPVRGILFDKQEGANWKVPWHQDVTVAVRERLDTAGYGPWSIKESVQHVQPPSRVLEQMASVRLHLDDCPASNGALRVIAGTHRLGRLDQNRIADYIPAGLERICEVRTGGALIMRPLLIHASSIADRPLHRRVIHIDYSIGLLDGGLEWFEVH